MTYLCQKCKMLLGKYAKNNHIVFSEAGEHTPSSLLKAIDFCFYICHLQQYMGTKKEYLTLNIVCCKYYSIGNLILYI